MIEIYNDLEQITYLDKSSIFVFDFTSGIHDFKIVNYYPYSRKDIIGYTKWFNRVNSFRNDLYRKLSRFDIRTNLSGEWNPIHDLWGRSKTRLRELFFKSIPLMEKIEQFYMFYDFSFVPNMIFRLKYTFLVNARFGGRIDEIEYLKILIMAELYQRLIACMVKNYYKFKPHFTLNPKTIIYSEIHVTHDENIIIENKKFDLNNKQE